MRYLMGTSEVKDYAVSSEIPQLFPTSIPRKPAASSHPSDRKLEILLWRMQTTHREGPQAVTFGDPQRKPSVGIRLPCIGAKQSVSLVSVTVSYCLMQMHTKDDQILEDRLQHERKKAKQITQVEK